MHKISVIIPCFNYAHFLDETIESVISQTHTNWECIIINDGSTDNTEEVALAYCKKDKRILYYLKQNEGLSSARNAGLQYIGGDFIQFLDADDILKPEKFAKQIEIFENNPEITICYSNFDYFDSYSKLILPKPKNRRTEILGNAYEDFLFNWGDGTLNIPSHCPIIKRGFLETNRICFNEELKAVEDWVFWVELARNGAKFYFIDEALALYRRHKSSMAQDILGMTYNYILAVFYIYQSLELQYKKPFVLKFAEVLSNSRAAEKMKLEKLKASLKYKIGTIIILPLLMFKRSIKYLFKVLSLSKNRSVLF